jgi:hypothetical protein
VEEEYD